MFYDPKSFKFITELGQSVDQIQAELKSLGRDVLDIHRNRRVDEFFALLQRTKNGWTPSWQVSSFAPPSLAGSSQYWELDSSEPNYNWLTYAITYDRKFL
ncbi:MAG: hypothetical protein JOZ59_00385, partial [Candidatus Eremiobacteraeota bacterium]|nr:hypothetical protein [Candidatus Eremiobacteraeota bacterium]